MAMCGKLHLYLSRCRPIQHLCLLVVSCVASSSPDPVPIVSTVGSQAVLPCSWKSELNVINNPICHIQWQTPASTVFEQRGTQRWEASEFKGRLVVPEDKLDQGDCSLILNDVQHGDVGLYESYVVVMKQRIFIQRVRLVVHDHKLKQSLRLGDNLLLKLHTPKSARVVAQRGNTSSWEEMWVRGEERLEERLEEQEGGDLVLRGLRREDEGTYRVLDAQGLAVSTLKVTVNEVPKIQEVPRIETRQGDPVGEGRMNRPSSLGIALLLSCLIVLL
ncbi:galectin 17 isoform X2 [Hypomesus transpacificus]|uniref:galectin 17 isoform X2 n=1 Tax=Hypomesus transpacificus TaxID=137520 RepID=UPI001F079BC8|nr:galectin 17 isoform X2 [Hypomesus transpacificus]